MTSPYGTGTVSTFPLSGNTNIDALVNIGFKWGAGGLGTSTVVTYSFPQAGAAWANDYLDGEPFDGFQSFNATQQNAARQAMSLWSEVANITFQEVPDTASDVGDIRFGFSNVVTNSTASAWAYYPYSNPNYEFPEAGDIWFDAKYPPNLQMAPGQWGFLTLMHEIGHAIGLDHPFDDGFGETTLPSNLNNNQYSVMAYAVHPTASVEAMTPMLLDILAIQYIYGANMSTRTGNDVYKFSTSEQLRTIWDAGGIDTIDISNQTIGGIVDLHDGAFSSIGQRLAGGAAHDNVAIAYNAIIENATGGSGGDTLIGNAVGNILTGNAGSDLLSGGAGLDTLRGGSGNDVYYLDDANDIVDEQANKDLGDEVRAAITLDLGVFAMGQIERATAIGAVAINLYGNDAANILTGNAAANLLNGAAGADALKGGAGNDVYFVDNVGDTIDEGANQDSADEVVSSITINLATLGKGQIEVAALLGTAAINATGNTLNNLIVGNSGNNTLMGGGGNDRLLGLEGSDTLSNTAGNNWLDGGNGDDKITGGIGNDTLVGAAGSDILTAGAGNDWLDGGSGADILNGGTGNDTYVFDDANDTMTDTGTTDLDDRVLSLLSIDLTTLAGGLIEHAKLLGGALNAIGNARDNTIGANANANLLIGDLGNDVLDGGAGADTMVGGSGKDTYVVDDKGDVVDEQGNSDAADRVIASITIDLALLGSGAIENALLLGNTAINASGNAANNILTGNDAANMLDGRDSNDLLEGKGGSDTLIGGAGNDVLDAGRAGEADVMKGGGGNDIYFVDSNLDTIDEEGNLDATDEVRASVSVDLSVLAGGAIENAISIGGFYPIDLKGNSSANLLVGDSWVNFLDGGVGNDTLRGGADSDRYTIDSLNDVVDEQGNKDIHDEVRSSVVSLDLTSIGAGAIEDARLFGSANLNITGNSAENFLFGNSGDNIIDGGAGQDVILAGSGNDVLISGDGIDVLNGESGDDVLIVPTIGGQLNGGDGFDEVKVTAGGVTIDLRSISDTVMMGIESIDLTGTGNNQLIASSKDISSLLLGSTSVLIKGDVGDSVKLTDTALYTGFKDVDGVVYDTYSYGSSSVYIEDGVSVSITPPAQITVGEAAGFRIGGPSTFAIGYSLRFGTVVSGIGDVNNDGFEDVLISSGRDAAYLLYGQADAFPPEFSADGAVGTGLAELAGASGSWTGKAFSGLGDFNGDGKLDLAIAAANEDLNGIDSGGVYVLYGTGVGSLAHESVPAMAGSDGFVVLGPGSGASVGSYLAVQGGGDFNGDGYDDLLVATPDALSVADRAAYVIYGAPDTSGAFALPTLGSGGGFKFTAASGSQIGGSMASAGDLNGDGYDDVVISTTSKSYVVLGGAQSLPSSITAESLNGSNGFSMSSGVTVLSSGGDFNGDGYDDLVVADSWADNAYVVFGKAGGFSSNLDLTTLNGSNGFMVQANWIGSVGNATSLTGDYDADGYDDLLIGVPRDGAGSALLIYGHAGTADSLVTLDEIDGQNGLSIIGISSDDYTGAGLSSADINGDGFDDILIGSAFGDGDSKDSGTLDVIYGMDLRNGGVIVGTPSANTLNGTSGANRIAGAQGNDTINGGGGADAVNGGQGDDEIHVADNAFFRIDGGTGVDALHLDYAGAIDFGNLDGNASTSDRNRIENVEVIDVDNGLANALTLHLADVLDLDVTVSNVGGVAALDNVLRIDGNTGDTLNMFNVDGWGAADTSSLTGYAIYSYQAVKVAVDTDIAVSLT